ncbi:hypothetical protein [Nocardioides sp. Arc9.136]|uniref:hypothetical protein n=1 Tax=Nocardioides sp. Arc9.136 TaxID=2996826 RepID=UPI0026664F1B|nr:hypothetical protein [Nocardioides sp. Arc9.136]WKN50347.1 hypothetical protein OSR43_09510 [Nocardioides sp. Arc9.136]
MTAWIVLVVVLVALALGYVLASARSTRRQRQRIENGIAGEHLDTKLDPHPGAPREE